MGLTVFRSADAGSQTAVRSVLVGVALDCSRLAVNVHGRSGQGSVVEDEAWDGQDLGVVEDAGTRGGGRPMASKFLVEVFQEAGDTTDTGFLEELLEALSAGW